MNDRLISRFSIWENEVVLFDTVDHGELMGGLSLTKNLGLLRGKGDELILNGEKYHIESINFAIYKILEPDNNNFQVVINVRREK